VIEYFHNVLIIPADVGSVGVTVSWDKSKWYWNNDNSIGCVCGEGGIWSILSMIEMVWNWQLCMYHYQQKLTILHEIYLVYCTHKLTKMKSRFPWNMALLDCSKLFFESSWCCFQASQTVYPLLQMWQRALDEQFTLPLAISQIISRYTSTLPN